ncbi:hypothetical protein ACLB2K_026954 [Fragaria x ananassa]
MSSGCNCGSDCKCGSGCKCGSMYPDLENTTTETIIAGVAPVKTGYYDGGSENGAENGCKCGSNCGCDSCGCGK